MPKYKMSVEKQERKEKLRELMAGLEVKDVSDINTLLSADGNTAMCNTSNPQQRADMSRVRGSILLRQNLHSRLRRPLTSRRFFALMQSGRVSRKPAHTPRNHKYFAPLLVFTQNMKMCQLYAPTVISFPLIPFLNFDRMNHRAYMGAN